MRATILIVALSFGALNSAGGQAKTASEESAHAAVLIVTALEHKWVEALVKGDANMLDLIFAETYVDTDERSERSDKPGVLALAKSGDLKLKSIRFTDLQVHVYGDAAVATGSATQEGTYQGQRVTPSISFTDTFIKQHGKWKAVASQRTAK